MKYFMAVGFFTLLIILAWLGQLVPLINAILNGISSCSANVPPPGAG